jgi:hypothetical protein
MKIHKLRTEKSFITLGPGFDLARAINKKVHSQNKRKKISLKNEQSHKLF